LNSNGLIHGDLKSENIIRKSENGDWKISDYALYKIQDSLEDLNELTDFGSRSYMSPEVLQNKNYTYNSDIY
jgi:serine/threonine protein kinase